MIVVRHLHHIDAEGIVEHSFFDINLIVVFKTNDSGLF
jgi:hypothetical protein